MCKLGDEFFFPWTTRLTVHGGMKKTGLGVKQQLIFGYTTRSCHVFHNSNLTMYLLSLGWRQEEPLVLNELVNGRVN